MTTDAWLISVVRDATRAGDAGQTFMKLEELFAGIDPDFLKKELLNLLSNQNGKNREPNATV